MRHAILRLAFSLAACGGAHVSPHPASPAESSPAASVHPCVLAVGTLEVPVPEGFALAAGEGACLLVDESSDASFVSIAALMNDQEGAELLVTDLRAFLRSSGIIGDAPRFTRRHAQGLLGRDVEVHHFIATPPQLEERAGFALRVVLPGGVAIFIGLSDSPRRAVGLLSALRPIRLASP